MQGGHNGRLFFFVDRSKKGVRGVPRIAKTDCRLRCWHFLKSISEKTNTIKVLSEKLYLFLGVIWVLFRLK